MELPAGFLLQESRGMGCSPRCEVINKAMSKAEVKKEVGA